MSKTRYHDIPMAYASICRDPGGLMKELNAIAAQAGADLESLGPEADIRSIHEISFEAHVRALAIGFVYAAKGLENRGTDDAEIIICATANILGSLLYEGIKTDAEGTERTAKLMARLRDWKQSALERGQGQ